MVNFDEIDHPSPLPNSSPIILMLSGYTARRREASPLREARVGKTRHFWLEGGAGCFKGGFKGGLKGVSSFEPMKDPYTLERPKALEGVGCKLQGLPQARSNV